MDSPTSFSLPFAVPLEARCATCGADYVEDAPWPGGIRAFAPTCTCPLTPDRPYILMRFFDRDRARPA